MSAIRTYRVTVVVTAPADVVFSNDAAMAGIVGAFDTQAHSVVSVSCAQIPDENDCPGHVASADDKKICGRCGVHIDSLRPPDDDE